MPVPSFLEMIDVGGVGEPWSGYGTVLSDMDDIWSNLGSATEMRFDLLDLPDAEFLMGDYGFDSLFDFGLDDDSLDRKDIVHHDCMWSGTCSDKSIHTNSAPPVFVPQPLKPALIVEQKPVVVQQKPVVTQNANGRSLLITNRRGSFSRTRSPRSSPTPVIRPETPQSLDEDEPPQFRHDDVIACCVGSNDLPLTVASASASASEDDDEEDEAEQESQPARDPRHSTVESDHSYTRSKATKHERFDNLGVQTPSDSEEEIDVVSVGAPFQRTAISLPTNPSLLDRHKLQRTVATAITSKREPCEGRVPPLRVSVSQPASRKRSSASGGSSGSSGSGSGSPPKAKRARAGGKSRGRASPPKRRPPQIDSDSESENVEKRSLHNDMERQRRIGLKNLFEQLKREVPATRDKERAPKVVILREAASLCTRLQREDRERDELRRKQLRLLATVKQLRLQLAAARPHP